MERKSSISTLLLGVLDIIFIDEIIMEMEVVRVVCDVRARWSSSSGHRIAEGEKWAL